MPVRTSPYHAIMLDAEEEPMWSRRWKLAALAALAFGPRAALACSPGLPHRVTVVSSTLPDCVLVDSAFSEEAGVLAVRNRCDETLRIWPERCDACGEGIEVAPSDSDELVLEDRWEEGLVSEQVLSWSLTPSGSTTAEVVSGTLETEVEYRDTSGACDSGYWADADGGGGCNCTTGPERPFAGGLVLVGLWLAGTIRRRGAADASTA